MCKQRVEIKDEPETDVYLILSDLTSHQPFPSVMSIDGLPFNNTSRSKSSETKRLVLHLPIWSFEYKMFEESSFVEDKLVTCVYILWLTKKRWLKIPLISHSLEGITRSIQETVSENYTKLKKKIKSN